jgi:hypothetical protein
VLDCEVYKEFRRDFCYTYWSDDYKKQSEVAFRHLLAQVESNSHTMCREETHMHVHGILCDTTVFECNMMHYHISHVEGYQA